MQAELTIVSPLSGKAVPLEEVPDQVFAQKMMGDGIAVIPSEGKLYSPIDGEIVMIHDSLHAYGIQSPDGIELLIHCGLETVHLKGSVFTPKVRVGDQVKAGDLLSEIDLDTLKEKQIQTITPIVITGGADLNSVKCSYGEVTHGDPILTCRPAAAEEPETEPVKPEAPVQKTAPEKPKKKSLINFDFLQKLGKSLMTVIAVMPAAGLAISLGNVIMMIFTSGTGYHIGQIISELGWAVINNLNILFAAAIGGNWAKDRAGGSFAASIVFLLVNVLTGVMLGVTSPMLNDPNATVTTLFGRTISVADYFVDVLGKPALNMGVFVGIISGFVGAMAYNKYYNFRKLPNALSFFNGKRFVPLVCMLYSLITALILVIFWPVVQGGINSFGIWIANSQATSPVLAPFIYGMLERLLLPFGLHHMLTIPLNYTSFGGTYTILTGPNAGTNVYGQDPLWLAWVTDLINFRNAGDMTSYNQLLTSITPARFKVGQMIGATGLLLGIALGMYRQVEPGHKRKYKSMFLSIAAAVFLTGVTEPIEFLFLFCALPLYIVYAVLQGCAFALAGIFPLRLHSFGNLELMMRTPLAIRAGLGGDLINFVAAVIVFFVIGYFVSYFMIGKFNYATPGRAGNFSDEDVIMDSDERQNPAEGNGQPERIITLLGGRENIELVDACMTRLRVTVKDINKVAELPEWKAEGAMGLVKKDNGVQAIYGPKADILKSDINDIL